MIRVIYIYIYIFFFFFSAPVSMLDLSSPIRGQTCAPCIGNMHLNHWTTRDCTFWIIPLAVMWRTGCNRFKLRAQITLRKGLHYPKRMLRAKPEQQHEWWKKEEMGLNATKMKPKLPYFKCVNSTQEENKIMVFLYLPLSSR